jgi:hypothetical protein
MPIATLRHLRKHILLDDMGTYPKEYYVKVLEYYVKVL